jgi:O-antigen/teichoic acid export membrane protein
MSQAAETPQRPSAAKGLLSVLDQAVVSGTSFATSVAIGRACSREELGTYALALSVALFVRGVQGELVLSPYTVYCARRQGPALAAYTGNALLHYLGLTALGTAFLAAFAGVLSLGAGPAGLAPAAWALAAAMPFVFLREYARQVSIAHLRTGAVLGLDASVAALQLGGLALLWWLGLLGAGAAFAVMGGACAAACLGWFVAGRPALAFEPARLGEDWRHNWAFGRWSLASFLVGSTTPYLMPWVVALTHGEAATGLLAACTTLVNCAGTYVTGVANLLTPRAARAYAHGGPSELARLLRGTALLFAVTLGAFCLAVFAAGDLPATLVYGDRYSGTAGVLALLSVAMLAGSLSVTAGNGLWALERPRANFAADVCTAALTAGGALALVPPLGPLGAALATLAGSAGGAAVRWWRLRQLLREARLLAGALEAGGGCA